MIFQIPAVQVPLSAETPLLFLARLFWASLCTERMYYKGVGDKLWGKRLSFSNMFSFLSRSYCRVAQWVGHHSPDQIHTYGYYEGSIDRGKNLWSMFRSDKGRPAVPRVDGSFPSPTNPFIAVKSVNWNQRSSGGWSADLFAYTCAFNASAIPRWGRICGASQKGFS